MVEVAVVVAVNWVGAGVIVEDPEGTNEEVMVAGEAADVLVVGIAGAVVALPGKVSELGTPAGETLGLFTLGNVSELGMPAGDVLVSGLGNVIEFGTPPVETPVFCGAVGLGSVGRKVTGLLVACLNLSNTVDS